MHQERYSKRTRVKWTRSASSGCLPCGNQKTVCKIRSPHCIFLLHFCVHETNHQPSGGFSNLPFYPTTATAQGPNSNAAKQAARYPGDSRCGAAPAAAPGRRRQPAARQGPSIKHRLPHKQGGGQEAQEVCMCVELYDSSLPGPTPRHLTPSAAAAVSAARTHGKAGPTLCGHTMAMSRCKTGSPRPGLM